MEEKAAGGRDLGFCPVWRKMPRCKIFPLIFSSASGDAVSVRIDFMSLREENVYGEKMPRIF